MSFFTQIKEDKPGAVEKAVQGVIFAANDFTSVLTVRAYQTINIGILIGSQVSDRISAAGGLGGSVNIGAAITQILSTASMSITLQRQMREEAGGLYWRDVECWSVTKAEGELASSENVSDKQEPEICNYRVGVKTGGWESGLALLRLGTS